jgi:hypothetical protein
MARQPMAERPGRRRLCRASSWLKQPTALFEVEVHRVQVRQYQSVISVMQRIRRCLAGSPSSTSSYPGLTRDILPDLWRDSKVLSNHQVTCPDTLDARQQGEAVGA